MTLHTKDWIRIAELAVKFLKRLFRKDKKHAKKKIEQTQKQTTFQQNSRITESEK